MNVDEMKALSLRAGRIMCVADCVYTGWHVHGLVLPQHRAAPNTTEPNARAVVAMSQHV